jgi:hypothetical protein
VVFSFEYTLWRLTWFTQEAKRELDAALDRADVIGRDFALVVEENKRLKRADSKKLVLVRSVIAISYDGWKLIKS